jgi:hypothetical protein
MLGNQHAVGHRPNATTFKQGFTPWNTGQKGTHLSPATEFKPGHRPVTQLPLGSVAIRSFRRHGNQRAFVKVAEPNRWRERALLVWERAHGPIPKGFVIHHLDRDPLNDAITNLQLQTRAEHLLEHRPEVEAKRLRQLRQHGRKKQRRP